MSADPIRAVYDCNILFQALISNKGPSYRCLELAEEGHVRLFLSEYVFGEIRGLANRTVLRNKFHLEESHVEAFLADVEKHSTLIVDVPEVYQHPVDPKDSHYVNLALAADARLIVSRDNHLLGLMDPSRSEGSQFQEQFPALKIVTPPAFLHEVDQLSQRKAEQ